MKLFGRGGALRSLRFYLSGFIKYYEMQLFGNPLWATVIELVLECLSLNFTLVGGDVICLWVNDCRITWEGVMCDCWG